MKNKVYVIQPTYKLMDGTLLKEFPLFNYSYNLPIMSATIPEHWEKDFCMEYSDEVDYHSDASVVLITSTGYDIQHAIEIAREFRSRGKAVIFGAHLDDLSDHLMKDVCDSVFYGYPTPQNMEQLLSDAVSSSLAKEYRFGMNIDFPFDYAVLQNKKMWFLPALASLGCRHSCSYCCYTPVYKGKYRLRHLDNVVADLRSARSLGRLIGFLDANLYNNRDYLSALCHRIIDERLHIRWGGQCTIDIGDDPEILHLMRKAGCRMLFFGLESLDKRNMEFLNKPFDPARYAHQVKQVRKAGIHVGAFFILGLDEDTGETFDRVHDFCRATKVAVPYIHLLVPVPGTPLEMELRSQDRLDVEEYDHYLQRQPRFSVPCSYAYFKPKRFTALDLERQYVRLFQRLASLPEILSRSLVPDPLFTAIIFMMNLEARRRFLAMQSTLA